MGWGVGLVIAQFSCCKHVEEGCVKYEYDDTMGKLQCGCLDSTRGGPGDTQSDSRYEVRSVGSIPTLHWKRDSFMSQEAEGLHSVGLSRQTHVSQP